MRLGEMLISSGQISEYQLLAALKKQQVTRERLGQVLIQEGALTEAMLLLFLSTQLDIPFLESISDDMLREKSITLLSESTARAWCCICLELDGELTVAVSEPGDDALELMLNETLCRQYKLVICNQSTIRRSLQWYGLNRSLSA